MTKEQIVKYFNDIKPDYLQNVDIEIKEHNTSSFAIHPVNRMDKSYIYIGILNKSKQVILGTIAHETAHLCLPNSTLNSKFYYKLLMRLTNSRNTTNKISQVIAMLTGYIYEREINADKLGVKLLESAKLENSYLLEFLMHELENEKRILYKLIFKKRVAVIRKLIDSNYPALNK